ncbi:MAG: SDR family NAD(P)-dependent oxidoreductase [Xanthobacteraceae bacterium]
MAITDFRMDGRVALVTGGSRGLGFAMARTFASAGAQVAIVARRRAPIEEAVAAIEKEGGQATGHVCDVSKADDIAHAFADIVARHGKVDILINNAGGHATGPFESLTDESWRNDLDLKLFAAVRFCRAALPGMRERKWGRVINVLNVYAKTPLAETAPTSVTRAAGLALTKVLSNEYVKHNVLVNALLVGFIETDQIRRIYEKSGSAENYEEFVADFARNKLKIGIGRFGKAEEFANAALFMCSNAGSYVSGVGLNIDGGYSPVV